MILASLIVQLTLLFLKKLNLKIIIFHPLKICIKNINLEFPIKTIFNLKLLKYFIIL